MNIQEEPLRNALNDAYAQIARSGSMMNKSDVLVLVEKIQLAVVPQRALSAEIERLRLEVASLREANDTWVAIHGPRDND